MVYVFRFSDTRVVLAAIAVAAVAGCVSPNPYSRGPAPVVDRSITDDRYAEPSQGGGPGRPGGRVEVTPLEPDGPLTPQHGGGLIVEDIPAPEPAGPPTIQRRPKPEAPPPPAADRSRQAVAALLNSAATHVNNGALDSAASDLERAVRIEPTNAAIWYDLGQIRLAQGNYGDAEAMAAKSNGLARGDRELQACNWSLIGSARRAQGNLAGADVADAQVTQFGGCPR